MKTISIKNLLTCIHVPKLRDHLSFRDVFGSRQDNKVELSPKGTERYFCSVISKNYNQIIPAIKKAPWVHLFDNAQTQFSSIKNMREELGVSLKDIIFNVESFIPTFYYFLNEGAQMRAFNGEMFPKTLVFLLKLNGEMIKIEAHYYSPSGYWEIYESILDENNEEYIDANYKENGVLRKGFVLNIPPVSK